MFRATRYSVAEPALTNRNRRPSRTQSARSSYQRYQVWSIDRKQVGIQTIDTHMHHRSHTFTFGVTIRKYPVRKLALLLTSLLNFSGIITVCVYQILSKFFHLIFLSLQISNVIK